MKKKIIIVCLIILLVFSIVYFLNTHRINESKNNKMSLNGDGDLDKYITYKNKKINFTKGKSDPENKVFYNEYNLIVTDNDTKTSKTVANTFDNKVTLCNNKIYYFVQNSENRDEKFFYSYNLDNEQSQLIELTPKVEIIYSMVTYDNNLYLGVAFDNYKTDYGILKYDVYKNESTVFSNREIRYLEDNFIYTGNGFVSVIDINNSYNLCFTDLNGNETIKFKTDLQLGEFLVLDDNILYVPVLGTSSKGSYVVPKKYLKFNINTFELIDEIVANE